MSRTDILIVSYAKDIPWLNYCLRSIDKFCTGFGAVTILVPQQEISQFGGVELGWSNVKTYDRNYPESHWHLGHQVEKCFADKWCPDADLILHTDSDCIFTEPVTPEDYFVEGKPVMLVDEFARIGHSPWKATSERALGMPVKYLTMLAHGATHYRGLYEHLRQHVALTHKGDFRQYVMSTNPSFPWGFSEFSALGALVMGTPRWKDKYHIIDVGKQPCPKLKLLDFWCHGSMDKPQPERYRGLFLPTMTVRDIFKQLGLEP